MDDDDDDDLSKPTLFLVVGTLLYCTVLLGMVTYAGVE